MFVKTINEPVYLLSFVSLHELVIAVLEALLNLFCLWALKDQQNKIINLKNIQIIITKNENLPSEDSFPLIETSGESQPSLEISCETITSSSIFVGENSEVSFLIEEQFSFSKTADKTK